MEIPGCPEAVGGADGAAAGAYRYGGAVYGGAGRCYTYGGRAPAEYDWVPPVLDPVLFDALAAEQGLDGGRCGKNWKRFEGDGAVIEDASQFVYLFPAEADSASPKPVAAGSHCTLLCRSEDGRSVTAKMYHATARLTTVLFVRFWRVLEVSHALQCVTAFVVDALGRRAMPRQVAIVTDN
jgi:hypothetical protein